MNFNSPQFLLFLLVALAGYALVFRSARARDLLLLAASYFFYMSWNWKYAALIAVSTVVDYWLSFRIAESQRPGRRKLLLAVSVCMNLGILFVFKYFNFAVDLTDRAAGTFGYDLAWLQHRLLLPIGISFYTFETLTYTIDVYRGVIKPERSLTKFALYLTFFPHLVAGPIVRAADFLPQLHRTPPVNDERVASGLLLMFRGLIKKIMIADLLASLGVDAIFASPAEFSSFDLLLGLYGYAFQIYYDFSGYTDIARGCARLFGFELPLNFDRPYLSQSPREFWTRWHISLSTWLRDYLYIPLGGNRGSPARVRFNLLTTMVLGGLWHGAALNFLFWGLYHGLLLALTRRDPHHGAAPAVVSRQLLRVFVTFHLVVFGWLLFRIASWESLVTYLNGLRALTVGSRLSPLFVAVLLTGAAIHFSPRGLETVASRAWLARSTHVQAAGFAILIVLFVGCSLGTPSFIYFQF